MFARMTVYAGCIVVGTPATLNYSSCAQFGNGTPIGRRQSLWLTKVVLPSPGERVSAVPRFVRLKLSTLTDIHSDQQRNSGRAQPFNE
jgi:hypothetical protein